MPARTFCAIAAAWSLAGCAWHSRGPVLPNQHSLQRDQLVIYSDFRLPHHHRLVDELAALRGDLAMKLALPQSDEPIYVYVFDGPEPYQAYMEHLLPDFPQRRALFLESDTSLTVYTQWGEQIAEDLRHEVTHGYLHSIVSNLPLWLDEGLAEYFEVPRGHAGRNQTHIELLSKLSEHNEWQPDLGRLEQFRYVSEMTQVDYAESWLWVYLLLETTPERRKLLAEYLAQLRAAGAADPISKSLLAMERAPDEALIRHLDSLKGLIRPVTSH